MSQLAVRELCYQYAAQQILNNLDLTVNDNEIMCLLGVSGCGKTTMLKAVAGLVTPSSGSIEINQKAVFNAEHCAPVQTRNIGMMFQDYALFPHLTVAQNVAFGLAKYAKKARQQRVAEMLELVQLAEYGERFVHQLSGGQQQRVAIARALAYQPQLLLLDEPFSNIDQQVRFELITQIRQIIKAQQVSAIFVTHSKDEAFAFADKLAIMHQGKIIQQGTPEQLFTQPNSKIVAEFLGTGFYVNAEQQDAYTFNTEYGQVRSTRAISKQITNQESSQRGQLYVRPHHVQLQADDNGNATVVAQRFVGSHYVYQLKLADTQQQLIEVTATEQEFLPAQRVSITIVPHSVNFFG